MSRQPADEGVTVVIATRDRKDELLETLDRLLALPERPTLVVVDNGSGDGTPAAVRRRFGSAVELVALPVNRGAVARNVGIARSRTALVAFSDDDSWWAPGALAGAAGIFAASASLGLLAARVVVEPTGRTDPTSSQMARSPLPPSSVAGPAGHLPAVLGFLGCGAVARRAALQSVGGFRAELGTGGEEEALALDLAEAGWELAYADGIVAHHRPSASRQPQYRRRQTVRNAMWTAWRRRPVHRAARRSVTVLVAHAGPAAALGLADAVRGGRQALADRRVLRPEVEASVRLLERGGRSGA
jgi:GT2 family glycosyltransferase